jgi:hypothetical protein
MDEKEKAYRETPRRTNYMYHSGNLATLMQLAKSYGKGTEDFFMDFIKNGYGMQYSKGLETLVSVLIGAAAGEKGLLESPQTGSFNYSMETLSERFISLDKLLAWTSGIIRWHDPKWVGVIFGEIMQEIETVNGLENTEIAELCLQRWYERIVENEYYSYPDHVKTMKENMKVRIEHACLNDPPFRLTFRFCGKQVRNIECKRYWQISSPKEFNEMLEYAFLLYSGIFAEIERDEKQAANAPVSE